MTRPSASLNWYEPGASGMFGGRSSTTLDATPAWYPGGHITSRGRHTRGWAPRLSPPAESEATYRGSPMLRLQSPLPDRYTLASPEELASWIGRAKESLGSRLVILGHHYQRDDVMRWADSRGDSFGLSRFAAAQKD